MQRDFTLKIYRQLLETLLQKGYQFVTYAQWAESQALSAQTLRQASHRDRQGDRTFSAKPSPLCILRHDVDRRPANALTMAQMESELGIKGTYYFRIVPESFDEKIIKEIAGMGHEVGYHYEEVDFAWRQLNGKWSMLNGKYKKKSNDTSTPLSMTKQADNKAIEQSGNDTMIDLAYEMFKNNLEKMRSVADIKTICMHGSPLSKYDNKEVWSHRDASGKKYSYKELGIIGEPYFDIEWNEFGYLTDTGRRWNGSDVSVRDKVSRQLAVVSSQQKTNVQSSMLNAQYRSTEDIIMAIERLTFPKRVMINVHPQRWTDSYIAWGKELVFQNIKNFIKRVIVMNEDF